MSVTRNRNSVYGMSEPLSPLFPEPIVANRAPTGADKAPLGTVWVNEVAQSSYVLCAIVNNAGVWQSSTGGGAGTFTSLTVDPGNILITNGDLQVQNGSIDVQVGGISAGGDLSSANGDIISQTGNLIADNGGAIIDNVNGNASGPFVIMTKTRAGGTIITGDTLGSFSFFGNDSASDILSAQIIINSVDTIGVGQVPSQIEFWTHPNSVTAVQRRVVIPDEGGLVINSPSSGNALTVNGPTEIQNGNVTIDNGGLILGSGDIYAADNAVDTTGATLSLAKSRAGGVIVTGDELGAVEFLGDDGTSQILSAAIFSHSTGTIAANRVPSILTFSTHPDSTAGIADRMTIGSTGTVTINAPDSGVALSVTGTISVSGVSILSGAGDPTGVVTAPQGSLYLNTTGSTTSTRAFINTNSGTGWTAITTAT